LGTRNEIEPFATRMMFSATEFVSLSPPVVVGGHGAVRPMPPSEPARMGDVNGVTARRPA